MKMPAWTKAVTIVEIKANMEELKKEIGALKDRLERSDISSAAVEGQAVRHLRRLMAADEQAFEVGFADLKQFWLSSVDWCSDLSKQVERLIIRYEDLSADVKSQGKDEK